jgi:hypothetical protein
MIYLTGQYDDAKGRDLFRRVDEVPAPIAPTAEAQRYLAHELLTLDLRLQELAVQFEQTFPEEQPLHAAAHLAALALRQLREAHAGAWESDIMEDRDAFGAFLKAHEARRIYGDLGPARMTRWAREPCLSGQSLRMMVRQARLGERRRDTWASVLRLRPTRQNSGLDEMSHPSPL